MAVATRFDLKGSKQVTGYHCTTAPWGRRKSGDSIGLAIWFSAGIAMVIVSKPVVTVRETGGIELVCNVN